MTYKYEFPDYDDELPSIDGFVDESWHNDVCPSLVHNIFTERYLKLWCDYKDPAMREVGGNQYTLVFQSEDHWETVYLFSTDDIEAMKNYIKHFIYINKGE